MLTTKSLKPFQKKIYLSSPTMHGEELVFMNKAYETNWMSTIGENIDSVEALSCEITGKKYAVGLCNCTSALHLCCKLAGERLYGEPLPGHGSLENKRVFCSDLTFAATLNPVLYENGIPVFIDTNAETWNMDPAALEKAFEVYPEVRLVVYCELYGFPGNVDKIKEICAKHNALLIEDSAEALGATINGKKCGSFGDYSAISFNGNKIITGSSGGCLLTDAKHDSERARKWSTQSRESAPWYQHNDLGFNYRMSNVIAGVIRGQFLHLQTHIRQKKEIYERYKEAFKDLPVQMNPILKGTEPNYWLSALIISKDYMCEQRRSDLVATYSPEHGKSCPTEILEAIQSINAEGRPIWKPMHLQPIFRGYDFITIDGLNSKTRDVGADIFERGCCLPSDNKMTLEEQNLIIDVIKRCFE